MYIGIDVGGTFTDAVVVKEGKMLAWAKKPTRRENLLQGILQALDEVLSQDINPAHITRVTLSTTMMTNQVIEGRWEPTDLYVIHGPGVNSADRFPVSPIEIEGYTDHRGIIVEKAPLAVCQVESAMPRHAAVSAKFSVRNPSEEIRLADWAKKQGYDYVSEGAKLSGSLNFIRRTNSAYFNSAISTGFHRFQEAVQYALRERAIEAPVYILKADGGSLPLAHMASRPVETVFTGPAASVLGMSALLTMPLEETVAIDIGGTTSDISLWKQGEPLLNRGGVSIAEYPTAVRSFQVYSVGVGGDSAVRFADDGTMTIGPDRVGPAMALGGKIPTVGDALLVLGASTYGDYGLAVEAMLRLIERQTKQFYGNTSRVMAQAVVRMAVQTIVAGIQKALAEENKKPIYVVKDIVEPYCFAPKRLVVVGGTATMLAPYISEALQIPAEVPEAAAVANAVGAAVASHTLEISLRVDTETGIITIPELGMTEKDPACTTLNAAKEKAEYWLRKEAMRQGLQGEPVIEMISEEAFPVIQGWKEYALLTVRMQLKAGVEYHVDTK